MYSIMHKNGTQVIPTLSFHYAIRFPDGTYYTGPDWVGPKKERKDNPANRTAVPMDIYTYTENRAHAVIRGNFTVFDGCTVERVI